MYGIIGQNKNVPSLYPPRDENPSGDTRETSGVAGLKLVIMFSPFNL